MVLRQVLRSLVQKQWQLVVRDDVVGDHFTAADVVIGSGLRWGTLFKGVPDTPEFAGYIKRMNERPALQRATRKDEELAKTLAG